MFPRSEMWGHVPLPPPCETTRQSGRNETVNASCHLSRLDYCNSILSGLLVVNYCPLQRAQNTAAGIVLRLSPRHHARPAALNELQWSPHRLPYQVNQLIPPHVYLAHTLCCPLCISPIQSPVSSNSIRQRLRSYDGTGYTIYDRERKRRVWRTSVLG